MSRECAGDWCYSARQALREAEPAKELACLTSPSAWTGFEQLLLIVVNPIVELRLSYLLRALFRWIRSRRRCRSCNKLIFLSLLFLSDDIVFLAPWRLTATGTLWLWQILIVSLDQGKYDLAPVTIRPRGWNVSTNSIKPITYFHCIHKY